LTNYWLYVLVRGHTFYAVPYLAPVVGGNLPQDIHSYYCQHYV